VPLQFDRDAEEQFLNKPVITHVAELTTAQAKTIYSDPHYANRDCTLRVRWMPSEEFRAGAYVANSGDHEIRLSYGTAIEIYRDAFVLPQTCKRVLIDKKFDPVFDLLGYGNRREDVLPAGLSAQDAKLEIIRMMTCWLFLHEQAHLLQMHGDIAKSEGSPELLSNDEGIIDEVPLGPKLQGRDAALRHAFEFAADYEATTCLTMVESIHGLDEARLWCLAAGLMSMFRRFYGNSASAPDEVPCGTHPHPGIRMRMTINRILSVLNLPDVAQKTSFSSSPDRARAIMDHAVYATDMFWHLRYLGLQARSPFLDTVTANLVVPPEYQKAIYEAWRSVRARIVEGHLGHGEGVVLFLNRPQAIGAQD
tara:strand:- start:278 stop:1372 length:1095 start_codon:yes stop_codon:yes gene_type:complete